MATCKRECYRENKRRGEMNGEFLESIGVEPVKVSESPEAYKVKLSDIKQSLAIIEELTREYSIHPEIRKIVSSLISSCKDRDYDCYIRKIVCYIKSKVKYVNDPPKTEVFQSPLRTLDYGMGDCDDHAILTATLLRAVGFKVKVVLGAPYGNRYDHVYVKVLHPNKGWLTIDTTSSNPMEGKMYPEVEVFTLGEEPYTEEDAILDEGAPVDGIEEVYEVEGELAELGEEPYELGRPFTGHRWITVRRGRQLYRELWYYRNGRRVKLIRRIPLRRPTVRRRVIRRPVYRRPVHRRPVQRKVVKKPVQKPSHVAASILPMLLPMAAVGGLIYLLKRK